MGFYFVLSLYDSLLAENWYSSLELFIIPLNRISSIFFNSIFISKAVKSIYWQKYLWLGIAVVFTLFMVIIPVIFVRNQFLSSAIVAILILSASIFTYILESKGRLFL
ncbi:MAG: hypothetical protein JEY91_18330 [Spirochaetaceae bacterium]|nr:hypothetical protein [Spirochaetaceae bacterium]